MKKILTSILDRISIDPGRSKDTPIIQCYKCKGFNTEYAHGVLHCNDCGKEIIIFGLEIKHKEK